MIELKNISRSRFQVQRLIKANEHEFKTFITLTFADIKYSDIERANKVFNSFRTYIKRLKNDFKYVCVPEFQKRGAVHYHLLTNIDYTDFNLLSQNEVKLWNPSSNDWKIGRNIKGWSKGYTMVNSMTDINVIGYLTKYLTKDIDNRLWGKRRYLYSQNLVKPDEYYINLSDDRDFGILADIISKCDIEYDSSYLDVFGDEISYTEYKKS